MFNIIFDFNKDLGGGKVFLNNLREDLINLGIYSNISDSKVIIFNSHHGLLKILLLKFLYYDKIFLHRIDGPIYKYRNSSKFLDKLIFNFAQKISNGIIFQSKWSYENNNIFFNFQKPYLILNNYADIEVFKKKERVNLNNKKLKIVSSSWSINVNKGISTYFYLDKYLDFNKYEFYFIGNKKLKFKNITNLGKKNSTEIAKILSSSDIFISPSLYESCSNSVIEALTVGLFTFYKENTSSSEFVLNGKSFNDDPTLLKHLNNFNFNINALSNPPTNSSNYTDKLIFFSNQLKADKKRIYFKLLSLFIHFIFFNFYIKFKYYKFKILNLFNLNI